MYEKSRWIRNNFLEPETKKALTDEKIKLTREINETRNLANKLTKIVDGELPIPEGKTWNQMYKEERKVKRLLDKLRRKKLLCKI